MIDFGSALYLGLRHSSGSLRPWAQLTTGMPAALSESEPAVRTAGTLAGLQGCEDVVMVRSTLHAFWDLFADLSNKRVTIYVDEATYPIALWGLTAAASRGVPFRRYRHQDMSSLMALLDRDRGLGRSPVVVTDGFCPDCGQMAPLKALLSAVSSMRGTVVIDDTQALGVFGRFPSPARPYGVGGGGSTRFAGVKSPRLLIVESLAKGFGAPVAAVAGSTKNVRRFASSSASRVHCSPPSSADLHAAELALQINREKGDQLRSKVLALTRRLRKGLVALGFRPGPTDFPVQVLRDRDRPPSQLQRDLLRHGIRAVLHQGKCTGSLRVSLLITAGHNKLDIDEALAAIDASRRATKGRRSYLSLEKQGV